MPPAGSREAETVVVKISGTGIDLEREIAISALPRLMEFLFGSDAPPAGPTAALHTQPAGRVSAPLHVAGMERAPGIVEYLRDKRPQTSSDTILVLAGFLELHEGRRPFGREDIRRLLGAARLAEPANLPRDVGVAVAKGYIQPLGDGFQLTNSGLDLIGQAGPLVAPRSRGRLGRQGGRSRGDADGG
jgi:hypothetical protein